MPPGMLLQTVVFLFFGNRNSKLKYFFPKIHTVATCKHIKKPNTFWMQFYLKFEEQPKMDRESLWHLPCDPAAMTIWNAPSYNPRTTMHIFKGASSKWSALPCTTSWQFWGAFRVQFKNFGDLVKMSLKLYVICTDNYDAASKLIIKKWQLSSKIIENNGHMTLQVGLHT